MNLKHIYELCTELQSISSSKEKEKFLVDNRCDEFDEFLKWLLDPQITTGIDKKKLYKDTGIESPNPWEPMAGCINDLGELLAYLKENNTGRDMDVWYCQKYIDNTCYMMGFTHDDWADFLVNVLTRRLKLGVNLKTVAKAYGKDFIHVHEVQLGSPRDKLRLKDGEWFSLSQKMNGIRCTYVDGKMISRQGKVFKGLDHFIDFFKRCNVDSEVVFDGELIRKNVDGISDNENFRLTTSIVNGDDGDKSQLEFVLFDALSLHDFYEGKSKLNYKDRRQIVDAVCDSASFEGINIRPVEIVYQGTDQTEIDKQLAIADAKGWEGLMLNKNLPYECKRTSNLIKIKSFKFSDLRIIGYEPGDGKYKGMLGAVVVDYKGNPVNVGSGIDDSERMKLWADPESLIGRIVTVKYKDVSQDSKTGKESLQFPVWCGLRDDKDEVSYE